MPADLTTRAASSAAARRHDARRAVGARRRRRIVLEKYQDFFRDFRGDTVHPSTLELLYELGWLDDFLKVPHNEMRTVGANIDGRNC